jgi:hypothetical protein
MVAGFLPTADMLIDAGILQAVGNLRVKQEMI